MMTEVQLAIALTGALLVAALLGGILHWIWTRLRPRAPGARLRMRSLADRLESAEEARDRARAETTALRENYEQEREAIDDRMRALEAIANGAASERETTLETALREARLDAETAMAGLRSARARIMALEGELDASRRGQPPAEG